MMALLAMAGTSKAQNAMTVADIELPQNSDAKLVVSFQLDAADTYTGYSFQLELPSELEFVLAEGTDVAYTKGSCHDESHSVTANLSEGLVKVAGLSLSSKPLIGTSGELLTFTIKPATTLTAGQTFTGYIKNILIVPVEGTKKTLADASFTVTIGEPADLRTVLDETSTSLPAAATGVDVRVKRTIKGGEWSTICLPFAMTAEQCRAAFGDDVQLGDYTGYATEEDADENIVGITVNFNAVSAIEANHPYVIKTGKDVTEFTLDGVDIDAEEEPTVAAVKRTKKQWSEMIGTNNAKTVTEMENCLFLSGGKFWYAKGDKEFKAFRGYFDLYDVITSVEEAGARISISFDGTATGIEDNMVVKGDGRYYNLRGQHVEHPSKGVYITNGKKVVVK